MKSLSMILLLVVAAGASAQRSAAPTPSTAVLSLALIPAASVPFQPDGALDIRPDWYGPSVGAGISCRYRFRGSAVDLGTELGYSYVIVNGHTNWTESLSILLAGLDFGLDWNFAPRFGVRGFAFGGYSLVLVQPRMSDNLFSSLFRLGYSSAANGKPFVGAGAELFWTFIPALSLRASVRCRYFFDLYADLPVTVGLSYNLAVGRRPLKPRGQPPVAPRQDSVDPLLEKLRESLAPSDPELLALSEHLRAAITPSMNSGVDRNLQSAVGFREGLRVLVTGLVESPSSDGASMGEIKPPLQTLKDGRGTGAELSVLYASLLESAGIKTAFISVPGHTYVAVALAADPKEARTACGCTDELLFREGRTWVPVEVMPADGSFSDAWHSGFQEWRAARKQALFCSVPAAPPPHPPAARAGSGQTPLPDLEPAAAGFRVEVRRLAARAISLPEARLMAAVTSSGRSPGALNTLGLLYARYGFAEKAEAQFLAAIEGGEHAPALVNLGNLRLMSGAPGEALDFFQRAAAAAPHDPAALLGLARSNFQLNHRWLAKEQHRSLQAQDPKLAEQFSYLGRWGEWTRQDAEAALMKDVMVWGEER